MNRLTLPITLATVALLFLVAGCVIQVRPDGGLRIDLPPMFPITLIGNTPNTTTLPVRAPLTTTVPLTTTPVMTATVTPTASLTTTATPPLTPTATVTATAIVTPTATVTGTATATATATLTTTNTPPLTPTGTITATGTTQPPGTPPLTPTGTITATGTPAPPTGTPLTRTPPATTQPGTRTPAPTGSVTPMPTATATRSATVTPTRPIGTLTVTPTRSLTTTPPTTPTPATPRPTPTAIPAALFLGSHRGYEANGLYTVVGEVINNVGYPVFNTKVVASFYDANGALIGAQETVTLLTRIGIELSSPFKLSIPSSGNINRYELTLVWDDISIIDNQELTILSQETRKDGQLEIFGELRNDGSVGVNNIVVVATFYDAAGAVVDVYQGTVSKADLASDETTSYSIVVPDPAIPYDRFIVQAQGALVLY